MYASRFSDGSADDLLAHLVEFDDAAAMGRCLWRGRGVFLHSRENFLFFTFKCRIAVGFLLLAVLLLEGIGIFSDAFLVGGCAGGRLGRHRAVDGQIKGVEILRKDGFRTLVESIGIGFFRRLPHGLFFRVRRVDDDRRTVVRVGRVGEGRRARRGKGALGIAVSLRAAGRIARTLRIDGLVKGRIFLDRLLRAGLENSEILDLKLLHPVVHGEKVVVKERGFLLFFLCGDPLFLRILQIFEEQAQLFLHKGRRARKSGKHLEGKRLDRVALTGEEVGEVKREHQDGENDHADRAEHLRDRVAEHATEESAAERLSAATIEFARIKGHVGAEVGHGVNEAGKGQKKHGGEDKPCQSAPAAKVGGVEDRVQKDQHGNGEGGGREEPEQNARDQGAERPRILREKAECHKHRECEEKDRHRALKARERLFCGGVVFFGRVFVIHHVSIVLSFVCF